jgi:signal peptidase I
MTPEPPDGAPASARSWAVRILLPPLARLRGPWRIVAAEASMLPTIAPGDWLLVDPTTRRWPRRGSLVVFREPVTGELALKRLAGRPGDTVPFEDGFLLLGADEAWLVSDASNDVAVAAGFGPPVDSRRYGPVPLELLVGRVWFRYGPPRRMGRVR